MLVAMQCLLIWQADLSDREACLCFVFARMRTIDEQHDKSRIKWTHLAFEE